jgi:hypothetical protein
MRSRSSIAPIVVLAIAVSCSGGSDGESVVQSTPRSSEVASSEVASSEVASAATAAATAATAAAVIAGFDDSPSALARSLGAVNESALSDPDALREEALAGLDSGDPDRRFVCVLALTMTASTEDPASIEALRMLSVSPDVTERLLAAGALAALGDKDGVGVLIDALVSDEVVRNVDPPFAAWRYARANLLLLVGQDLGLVDAHDAAAATAAQPAWVGWWAEQSGGLTWNAELGLYEAAS